MKPKEREDWETPRWGNQFEPFDVVDSKRKLFDPVARPEPIVNGPVEIGRVYAVADSDDLHLSSKLVEERTVGNGRFIQHDMVAGNPSGCQPLKLHSVRVNGKGVRLAIFEFKIGR